MHPRRQLAYFAEPFYPVPSSPRQSMYKEVRTEVEFIYFIFVRIQRGFWSMAYSICIISLHIIIIIIIYTFAV